MDDFKNDLHLTDDTCPNCGNPDCMGDCTNEDTGLGAGGDDDETSGEISSFGEE